MTSTEEFNCEEILLPESNTNGETGEDENNEIEYLEEHDPMSEIIENAHENNGVEEEEECDDAAEAEGEAEAEVEGGEDEDATIETTDSTGKISNEANVIPKKRKNSIDPATSNNEEQEPATTSRVAAGKADNQVDEEQCRVCTAKIDLVSLFKKLENEETVADMLMMICPTVSIAQKDFMPQFICNPCLDNVTIAVQLKTQCETTERELRKKLSRSKNKVRRPVGYVIVDATIDSDPPSDEDEEQNDDVEFKVSEDESASADDDSEDSDFSDRRRISRGGGGRSRRKPATAPATLKTKNKRSFGEQISDDERRKRKKTVNSEPQVTEFPCDECDEVFNRKLSLVLHKKSHDRERTAISCEICGKHFKMQGAYRTHLQKHKEEPQGHPCDKCDEIYATNADLKRHLAEDHDEKGAVHKCKKCQRTFIAASRLYKHTLRCPGYPMKHKGPEFEGHVVGQDLFKTVAPLQSTYWSDSFSD